MNIDFLLQALFCLLRRTVSTAWGAVVTVDCYRWTRKGGAGQEARTIPSAHSCRNPAGSVLIVHNRARLFQQPLKVSGSIGSPDSIFKVSSVD